MEDLLQKAVDMAHDAGAEYADARYQNYDQTLVIAENGALKSYESEKLVGAGIRVLLGGAWGFASTNQLDRKSLMQKAREAVKIARASRKAAAPTGLAEIKARIDRARVPLKVDLVDVSPEKKIRIALEANRAAMIGNEIKNSFSRLGMTRDVRTFISSDGSRITTDTVMTGFSQRSVAKTNGNMEQIHEQRSLCAGFEFIDSVDWTEFAKEVSELALKAVKARSPPPGVYPAVIDPELIGLFLHEATGHASEGDSVTSGESVLEGKLGKIVASELVTIYDDGRVEGGYFLPYDDEGVEKGKVPVVDRGVLKGYLTSRETAFQLGMEPTGNGRAQNFQSRPIVRQTNYYMQRADHTFDELIEDIDYGFYIRGKGSTGGQVDVGGGTFTFRAGPSYTIEHGKLKEMVRGVNLSGKILETLRTIEAVGKDFMVTTSVFGGCGKDGQLARVGDGGPHVRIGRLTIGGRT